MYLPAKLWSLARRSMPELLPLLFIGIPEDPATGSAGGALGAYLVHHKVIENLDPSAIVIEQGFEMNRPSTIQVSVRRTGEKIHSIQVGGQAITVLEGNLRT